MLDHAKERSWFQENIVMNRSVTVDGAGLKWVVYRYIVISGINNHRLIIPYYKSMTSDNERVDGL